MTVWATTWAAALLALVLAAGPTTEESALIEKLKSGAPAERRAAAVRLGEVGTEAVVAELAKALRDATAEVRDAAQGALWAIWLRSGNAEIDGLLQHGIMLTEHGRFPDAVAVFSEVIARAPNFAEGWNKRATVYYLMGDYDRSLADCDEVIRRNPIHFGALAGYGLIYLQKGDFERAAQYFERALTVNPNLEQIEVALEQVRQLLVQRKRQTI